MYIYSKSLEQPKYQYLKNVLEPVEGVQYFEFSKLDDAPDSVLPNSIMSFDDIACENQDSVKAYFCRGRYKSVDCICLGQSYARVPKHLVRDNVNLLVR